MAALFTYNQAFSLIPQLVKNLPAIPILQFNSWVRKIPWKRERLPTPVFWPGEFHRLYSPWGHKESDTTEQLSLRAQTESAHLNFNSNETMELCDIQKKFPFNNDNSHIIYLPFYMLFHMRLRV